MPERRRYHLDLLATALLLIGLLVALAVFSQETADLPGPIGKDGTRNLLGPLGAGLAEWLQAQLGLAIHVLLGAWFVLVLTLFLRRDGLTWSLRLAGWLLLVPAAAVSAHQVWPTLAPGGQLGLILDDWLTNAFHPIGRWMIFGSILVLGLLLALDFALVRLARGSWLGLRGLAWGMGTGFRWLLAQRRLLHWPWDRSQTLGRMKAEGGRMNTPPSSILHPSSFILPDEPTDDPGDAIPIRHAQVPSLPTEARDAKLPAPNSSVPVNRHAGSGADERYSDYQLPPLTLLEDSEPQPYQEQDQKLRDQATLLEKTFTDFGLRVKVVGINTGPVVTQYEVSLETGLRVHKVTALADDLALNLRVPSIRMVAPIPGKNAVGVEVPNEDRAIVRLKEVILASGRKIAKSKIPLFLGKDTEGRPLVYDLAEMPHLLIAGRTGTGKSVCMNAIILSMLMTRRPDEVKMIMIDPKTTEMSEYGRIPHLLHPVVIDMKKAEAILAWAVDKMEERYDLLRRARVRAIANYNELPPAEIHRRIGPVDDEERKRIPDRMPYLVIFVDEMADLILTMKKEVESHIIRLAQKSRAAGIHLVVATQKPTVDVITGLIKSNLPARICFQVASRTDSRVVLDEMGADKLLGKGDMLFLHPGTSTLNRAQGTYASDGEISRVVEYLECEPCFAEELMQLSTAKAGQGSFLENIRARDELYEQAIEVVVREGRGSVSLLQRALGIGYGRAARLVDYMAEDGIVGDYNGSQARDVIFTPEQWDQMKRGGRLAS